MARERRHRSRPRRRRGRFSGLYKLVSVLLIAAAMIAAAMVFFRVNRVEVVGNSRYDAQEVIDASGIQIGDNLIALSRTRVAARIRVGLPYVHAVSIDQIPPDTVRLTVIEHPVAAAIQDENGGWWYMSASGKLLEPVDAPSGVMRIRGLSAVTPIAGDELAVSEERENRRGFVLSLLSELEKSGFLADCSQLDCSGAGVLQLDYLGFRVKMPTTGDFAYMLAFLDKTFDTGRVDRTESGTFDFTAADGKAYFSRS